LSGVGFVKLLGKEMQLKKQFNEILTKFCLDAGKMPIISRRRIREDE
jgi:hypothetical protein